MPFKIEPKKGSRDGLDGPVINALINTIRGKPSPYATAPHVIAANFDGNKAELDFSPGLQANFPEHRSNPITPTGCRYSQEQQGKAIRFDFEFSPDYELFFAFKEGFLKLSRTLLTGNKAELEGLLGSFPEKVQVDMEYNQMPLGLWHGIPKKVLDYVTGFRFATSKPFNWDKGVSVSWPYSEGTSFPQPNTSQLSISRDYQAEDEKNQLTRRLLDSGIIVREVTEQQSPRTGPSKVEKIILASQGMDPEKIKEIEKHLGSINNGYGLADLIIKGELQVSDFVKIPELFEEFMTSCRLTTPKFGIYHQRSGEHILNVTGDLETAARISQCLGYSPSRQVKFYVTNKNHESVTLSETK
jgi:hypothetical protein